MLSAQERADQLVREAEAAKAHIFPTEGNVNTEVHDSILPSVGESGNFQFIAKMDQDYQVVGGHVDDLTKQKIIKGEYVDFSKLLPKDRILVEEEGRMELVIRNGKTFWVPVSESVSINNFRKWEQAFRIFVNIYTRQFPQRFSELIEYNHIIHSIASVYTWENVYSYDKEFRLHLSRHPERSWSVILQQAWSMKLRDRIHKDSSFGNKSGWGTTSSNSPQNFQKFKNGTDACKKYNKGKCTFSDCKYDHKCLYCGKFGHPIINCRKMLADREQQGGKRNNRESTGNASAHHFKDDNGSGNKVNT